MKNILIISLLISIQILSQIPGTTIPIATDSTINEIDPYLTYYWYDGMVNGNICSIENNINPLWLAFTETDSENFSRIAAYNFNFRYGSSFSVSDKFLISDTTQEVKNRHPIIENFLGKPVAIWEGADSIQTDLYYSVLSDSTWAQPQKITDDSLVESSAVFITNDAWDLESQDNPDNYLFWISGNSINSAQLDSDYNWQLYKNVFSSDSTIENLKARVNEDELWVIFDEKHGEDSTYVRVLILISNGAVWNGPYTLLKVGSPDPQANINLFDVYYHDKNMLLSWCDINTMHDTSVSLNNDSIIFRESNYNFPFYPLENNLNYVSNTLIYGGCIIDPFPYFFVSSERDSIRYFEISYSSSFFDTTRNEIGTMAISGLNNQHFLCAWSEIENGQSDIYLTYEFIPIGAVEDEPNSIPSTDQLFQNWPNPFNPVTNISYFLKSAQKIEISLHNILGEEIQTLYSGFQHKGNYEIPLKAHHLPSGVYFYSLKTESNILVKKCLLIK